MENHRQANYRRNYAIIPHLQVGLFAPCYSFSVDLDNADMIQKKWR